MRYLFGARARAAAVALVVALTACGRADALDPRARRDLADALRRSQEAVASARALELRLARLQSQLRAEQRARRRLERRIGALAGEARGLGGSLAELRAGLSRLEPARASAAAASARAEDLARQLAVVDKRLDYHLSKHGGG